MTLESSQSLLRGSSSCYRGRYPAYLALVDLDLRLRNLQFEQTHNFEASHPGTSLAAAPAASASIYLQLSRS